MILDIRTKVLLLLFANYLLFKRVFNIYEWIIIIFISILFLLAKRIKKACIYFCIFVVLFLIEQHLIKIQYANFSAFFSMLSIGGRLLFTCFYSGSYLFTTTKTGEMLSGLRKWKIPMALLLVIIVMQRFIPLVKQNYIHIKNSLLLKGEFLKFYHIIFHPIKYYEKITIPLLLSLARAGNELVVATTTKGIILGKQTTNYLDIKLQLLDYFTIVFLSFLVFMIESGFKL